MNVSTDYDLIIVGGGMVGASLAISLAKQALRIALIDAAPLQKSKPPPSGYDDRAIALSFGSRCIFDGMGLWTHIEPQTTSIQRIHVSDQGCFGFTRVDAVQEKVDALGYVATAQQLGAILMNQLQQCDNLTLISPARLVDLKLGDDHATVIITHDPGNNTNNVESLTSKLVVAADGGSSHVRNLLDIHTTVHDYGQTAIIANITPEKSHKHIAYERFTRDGPLALLPMVDNRCSLVWTRTPEDVQRLFQLSDKSFLGELQSCFGKRLGRFTNVGKRHSYPLQLIQAKEQIRTRLVLIGNAAHTLHPIAGQGFNLGLRDVAALAQNIADAFHGGDDIGGLSVLKTYAQWRERDHRQVIGFTNTLVNTFSNRFPPLVLVRNLGLIAIDIVPPLKHRLARHSMGLVGKLPRLARGLPL